MKGLNAIPSTAEFVKCAETDDELAMVVRVHQCLAIVLDNLISEMLPCRHEELVKRLQFGLKVDLAIGLFALPQHWREALLAVNRLRNKFAHQLSANISEHEAAEFRNSLPPLEYDYLSQKPQDDSSAAKSFRRSVGAAFIGVRVCLDRLKDQRLWDQATAQLMLDTVAQLPPRQDDQSLQGVHRDIRERYEKLKEASIKANPRWPRG